MPIEKPKAEQFWLRFFIAIRKQGCAAYLPLFFKDKDFTSFMPIYIIRGMVNINEHTAYWKNGAVEDLDAAEQLIHSGKARHGLFFAHLSIEKMLKANICKTTRQMAPKIHNLVRLAECADLKLEDSQRDLLAEMNEFNLEGRYPTSSPPISPSNAKEYMERIKEVFQWLMQQL